MSLFSYPNARYTSNIGFALFGQDEVLAENWLLADAAYGSGSSINVNGTLVPSPNLSSTLPVAPPGDQLVTFQFDINGNISAYVPTPAPGGVTSLSGDSVVYNNALSVGAVTLSLISQTANTVFAGPTLGGAATPTFRALVAADIPALPYGTGTVTSVAMTGDGTVFNASVTGSPITTSGTLAPTLHTQVAFAVLAGPNAAGPAAAPTFRALVAADIPALPYVTSVSSGNIDSIATVSVATATTTPAISFVLATQTANTVWAGPTTGAATAPTFRVLVAGDIPALAYVTSFSAGSLSPLFTTSVATATTTPALTFALSNAAGGTVFGNATTGAAAPGYTIAPVLGIPGTSTGTIALASSTASGKYTITAPANAATPTLTLPTTSNVLAGQFAGDGVMLVSTLAVASAAGTVTATLANAAGGTVFGRAAGTTGAPSYTTAPVLGIAGTSTGTIALASSTANGLYTITAPANAATPTLTLPTGSGTFAISASGALSLDATTGALTFSGAGGAVLWSQLGNAAADLTLANAGFKTTFNQTSAVAWLWANTTVGTIGSTNASPLLELAANYWATGGATGVDLWTVGIAALTAGLNSPSTLTFTHTGSTGSAAVRVPLLNVGGTDAGISRLGAASLAIGNGTAGDSTASLSMGGGTSNVPSLFMGSVANVGFGAGAANGNMPQSFASGSVNLFSFSQTGKAGGYATIQNLDKNTCLVSAANVNTPTFVGVGLVGSQTTGTVSAVGLGNNQSFTATSGAQIAVQAGFTGAGITFNPASGTASFQAFVISPTIQGTSSGATTALVVNPTLTATNLSGVNLIASFQSGGVQKSSIDYAGNFTLNRVNLAGADYAGQATITAGGTTQAVTFAANYTGTAQPVIVITPTSDPLALGVPVGYWVTYSGGAGAWSGFTVNIQTALAGNVTFNYLVVGKA